MKKTLKSLSIVILFLALAVVPVLAGCAKTYTVNVSITGGNQNGGYVTHNNGNSVYGANAVTEGDDFIFTIHSFGGYYISSIKVNNKEYESPYNKYNYEFELKDVAKDTNIEVSFARDSFLVEVYACTYNEGGQNTGFSKTPYKTYSVLYGDTFRLLEFGENIGDVFYYLNNETHANTYINTSYGFNIWTTGRTGEPFKIYTLKTAEELDDMRAFVNA